MAQAQRTGRSRHRLILLALTAITLLTIDLNSFGPAEAAQRVMRDALHPVTTVASAAVSPIGDAWNSVFNYGELEDENAALKAEIEELRGTALRGEADTETLRRILEANELPYIGERDTVLAEVKGGVVGNFDDHVITIGKGRRHGIEEGMAAVTAAGLVGRVEAVDNSSSTVRLLSDASLFVGSRLGGTDDVGLGHAVPGDPGLFIIDRGISWPDNDDPTLLPEIGSLVVTSSGSRHPAEVPIGRVLSVDRAPDEVSMWVTVELSNDVTDLQFIKIVLAQAPDDFPLDPVVPTSDIGQGLDPSLLEETPDGADE